MEGSQVKAEKFAYIEHPQILIERTREPTSAVAVEIGAPITAAVGAVLCSHPNASIRPRPKELSTMHRRERARARPRIERRRGTKNFRASDANRTPTGHFGTLIAKLLILWRSLGGLEPLFSP
jgi:hypothetical protein